MWNLPIESTIYVFVRLTPLLVVMPVVVLGRIPVFVRLVVSLSLALVIAGTLPPPPGDGLVLQRLAGEFLVGLSLAFGIHAASGALDFMGQMVDTQVGLNAAAVFNPISEGSSALVAELLALSMGLVFIGLDIHHAVLQVFSRLFDIVPVGRFDIATWTGQAVDVLGRQFLFAFIMMMPIIMGLWLADIGVAIASRSLPQANIYFLALPAKLALGFALFMATAPMIVARIPQLFDIAFTGGPAAGALP
ncbi:MAG: Flagellar biosynthetic protein [Microvirga sp.]|jgi:flagellar biosynthesis protein FliR|nr:Flagellar biosynthetic protein [Microvirga sp.]